MKPLSRWKSLSPWTLAVSAMAAMQVFGVFVAFLHVYRPDLDPVAHHVSEYADGDYGWLMTAAFIAAAVGTTLLAMAARSLIADGWQLRFACLLLSLASIAQATMAVFPTDAYNAEGTAKPVSTWIGDLHDCAANWNLTAILGTVLLLPWAMRRDPRWRGSVLSAAEFGGAVAAIAGPFPGVVALVSGLLATRGLAPRDRVYGAASMFAAIAVAWHFVAGLFPANEGLLQRGWILASLVWALALCESLARHAKTSEAPAPMACPA